jgi:hypothetical protein
MQERLKHKGAETVAKVVYVGTRLLGGGRQEATEQGINAGKFVDAILNERDKSQNQEQDSHDESDGYLV